MSKQDFKWGIEVFPASKYEVELPAPTPDSETSEVITFKEFPRQVFLEFFQYINDTTLPANKKEGEEEENSAERYKILAESSSKNFHKWLSKATEKPEAWWKAWLANATVTQCGYLYKILYEVNHLNDFLQADGNMALLPMMKVAQDAVASTLEATKQA